MWIQQQYQQQQQQQQQPQTPTPQNQTPHSQPLLPLLPQHTQMAANAAPQQQQQPQQWQPQPTLAGYGYSPQGNGNAAGFGASHSSSQSLTTPLGYPKPVMHQQQQQQQQGGVTVASPPQHQQLQQHQHPQVAATMTAPYAVSQPPQGQYIYMPQALQQPQQLPQQQYAYAPQPSNSSSLQPQSSSGSGGAALSGAGASGAGQPTLVMLPNGTFALLQASPAASQASLSGGSPGLPQHGGITVGGHNGGITLPAAAASGFNSSQSAMSPLQQQQQQQHQQQQPRYVQPQNLSFAGQQHQMGSSQTQMPHIYIAPQQQPAMPYGASLTTMPTVQVGAGGMPTPPRAGLQLGSSSNSAGQSLSAMLAGSGNPSPNASATRMPANNFNASSSQSSRPLCDTSVWGYAVVDPYHQALQRVPVPPSVVLPTRGLKNYNNDVSLSSMKPCTSIMCMRYLAAGAAAGSNNGSGANNTEGCPMDEQCHSFHVKHRYVEDARNCTDALCCGLHNCYYTREMMRANCAPHMTDAKITLVLEDRSEVDVLPSQLAFTIGLDHLSIRGQSRVINMRKHVCRLHLEGRCKWTKDCGHVHLCREFHRALTAFHFPSLVFLLSTETDVQKLRAKLSEVAEFVGSRSCIPLTSHLLAAKRTVAVRCMTEAGALFTPGMARAAAAEFDIAVPEKQVLPEADFISDIFRAPGPPTRPNPIPDTVVAKPATTPPVQPLPMGVCDSAELTPGREGASNTPSGAVESSSPGLTPQPTPAGGLSSEAASLPVALA